MPAPALSGGGASLRERWRTWRSPAPQRLAVGLSLLGAATLVALGVNLVGPLAFTRFTPPCMFHVVTGWHCPGCGGTRCALALCRGDWAAAFGFHPLAAVVLPLVLLWTVGELVAGLTGWRVPQWRLSWRWGAALGVLLVLFGIVRNLPWTWCGWLAP